MQINMCSTQACDMNPQWIFPLLSRIVSTNMTYCEIIQKKEKKDCTKL